MNLDPQNLGCYFMYKNLPAEFQEEAKEIISKQIAMYTKFTEAIDTIYKDCLTESGDIKKEPDMNKVDKWREKLHRFLDQCDEEWDLFIKTSVCKSKKKSKKKRYKKIKSDEDFYEKHVWPHGANPDIFIKQLEFILKDEKGEKGNYDDCTYSDDSDDK